MLKESVEEYLGAIYRLRTGREAPLPLSQLADFFGFSVVSVHEMALKLERQGWLVYYPYRGVMLTPEGEHMALALLRRHRLWERFLTDVLHVAWDEAHVVAGQLEHAAPGDVTERLAVFLGEPKACPHGAPIPPVERAAAERSLAELDIGMRSRVTRIVPETGRRLQRLRALGVLPGCALRVVGRSETGVQVALGSASDTVWVLNEDAMAIWITPSADEIPSG